MKFIKNIIITVFLSTNCCNLYGQDIHFSNFYNTPLIINPANTGNYIGNWRIISNYRDQGGSDYGEYKTSTVAFDMPIYYYKQMGSIGLILINDNSADNTLLVNKAFLSIAHFIKVSSKSYLHMGFQLGVVHKKFSLNDLSFPDQYDMSTGHYNPDLPTMEITENQNLTYLDLNWGLIWSRKSSKFNSEIGISMFHYNTPNENFTTFTSELPARYLSHAYLKINFKNNLYLKPKFLYTYQNAVSELLLGQDVGIHFKNDCPVNDFNIGLFYRGVFAKNMDGIVAKAGFQYKSINLGICYDFEIANQTSGSYAKSSFEISLQYTRPDTNLKNRTIPCETF